MDALFSLDRENNYVIFTNSFGRSETVNFSYPNVFLADFSFPNKVLNALMYLTGFPRIDALAEKKMSKIFKKEIKIDAFWAPNLNFIKLRAGTKFFLTAHDLSFFIEPSFFTFKQRLWHILVGPKALFARANAMFPVSYSTALDLELSGVKKDKIFVINPGISKKYFFNNDSEVSKFSNRYGLPEKFVLTLASLGERKNLQGVIKAFYKAKLDPEIKLVVAGFGTEKLKNKFKDLDTRIIFLGSVNEGEKLFLYKAAQFFIYPSFYEGFGLPILEAMAAGTPVIASGASGMLEVGGDAAILVDPHDMGEIASAIALLANSSDLREHLAVRGRKLASAKSWEESAKKLLQQLSS